MRGIFDQLCRFLLAGWGGKGGAARVRVRRMGSTSCHAAPPAPIYAVAADHPVHRGRRHPIPGLVQFVTASHCLLVAASHRLQWLLTIPSIEADDIQFLDFCEEGRRLARQLADQVWLAS